MSARFFFPDVAVPGAWDIGQQGILVPRHGYFSGNVSANGFLEATDAAFVAGTNAQGQGPILASYNIVTTAAANPSGVTLPTPSVGRTVSVINKGANPLKIYPSTGVQIDALGANVAIDLAVGKVAVFKASSTTQWFSVSAAGAATSAELAAQISDETGSGALVFGTGPSLTDPQVIGGINNAAIGGQRNGIINGGMWEVQRGTKTLTVNVAAYGGCDRMVSLVSATTATCTASRQLVGTGGAADRRSPYAHRISGTTTGTSGVQLATRLPSEVTRLYSGKTVTVHAKVTQNTGGAINCTVGIHKANTNNVFSAVTSVASAATSVPSGTPTKVKLTATLGATDGDTGLELRLSYSGLAAFTSKDFEFSDWQIELGSNDTIFELVEPSLNLVACQGYWRCTNRDFPTGAAVGAFMGEAFTQGAINANRQGVPMRATPARTVWNNGTQGNVRTTATGVVIAAGTPAGGFGAASATGFSFINWAVVLFAVGSYYDFDLQEDAELV